MTPWPEEAFQPIWLPPTGHIAVESWPTTRLHLRDDGAVVSIAPPGSPTLGSTGMFAAATLALGFETMLLRSSHSSMLAVGVLFVLALALTLWTGMLAFGTWRESAARGACLSWDAGARRLGLPRSRESLSRADIRCLQLITGPLGRHCPADVLCVVYQDAEGRWWRQAVANWLCSTRRNDIHTVLPEFAAIARIPAFQTTIETLRPESLDQTPPALGSAGVADRIIWPIDHDEVARLLAVKSPTPVCLVCDYSLLGLDDPPRCPECGTDFMAQPGLRT